MPLLWLRLLLPLPLLLLTRFYQPGKGRLARIREVGW